MDPEPTPTPDDQPEWRDPFCEPQTIPSRWDFTGIRAASTPAADDRPATRKQINEPSQKGQA